MSSDTTRAQLVLLRAVNVAGNNVIPMVEMRALMADLGYPDAATYLQSGNVLVSSDAPGDELAASVRDGIADRFGHDVSVLTRTRDDLAYLITSVPWQYPANSSSGIVFMSGPVDPGLDTTVFAPDEAVIDGSDIHVDCPTGFGKTKLTVAWIEKQPGLVGTRRNWKSVKALHERLEAFE